MRIGVRLALSALVLGCIIPSSLAVHALWRRTADSNSRALVATLNRQITDAVRNEVAGRIANAEAAFGAVRTIFLQNVIAAREADKREFVFLSQIQAQPSLSWLAFGWPDGSFFASHKLGDGELEMMEISVETGERSRRVDRYKVVPGDIEFEKRSFEPSRYVVTEQPWYRQAVGRDGPAWFWLTEHPASKRAAIAFAGPIDVYHEREGVLAVIIELDRLSRFLGGLAVARTGAAFILASDGHVIAGPDRAADEVRRADFSRHAFLGVAREVGEMLAQRRDAMPEAGIGLRVVDGGVPYAVTLAPLGFEDWRVAVIIPESEFLGEIEATTTRLGFGLLGLVMVAGLVSVLIARRLLADPLHAVVGDLGHVERFELDRIERRPSWLTELDTLSTALTRVAVGLSAFAKYIPTDLVRMLIAEGVEAKPGGDIRPLTILFADLAGFTGLSERLGARIMPLISAYLDVASGALEREGGTIDKFIGDAVMAFWGAPRPNDDHALAACRAALRLCRAMTDAGLRDDERRPLTARIGINSGVALVGNIGSAARLNYTAIGDAVNVASRLESANKVYGTAIILGEETRLQAGNRIVVRELDRIAVYGRAGGIAIFELIGLEEDAEPPWVAAYAAGLAFYRERRWQEAEKCFAEVLAIRGEDAPSRLMIGRCRSNSANPPADAWEPVTVMATK